MASSPMISWQIQGGKVEAVTDFIFLSSKITVDCSHEIQRCLLLGRKATTNIHSQLQHVKKQRETKEPVDEGERGE